MVFSLKYKPIKLSSNKIIYRPLVPINFNGKKEKIDIFGLLDSGSDITIIPIDLAEILEIEFIGDNEIDSRLEMARSINASMDKLEKDNRLTEFHVGWENRTTMVPEFINKIN